MTVTATRRGNGPIIEGFQGRRMGGNVNGPSLIRTPDWLECRLGRYHLYFAHHQGLHIRMAYADALDGPWEIYEPGVLDLSQTLVLMDHIASPDVHVDHVRQELRMYFHGVSGFEPYKPRLQSTCVAHSFDGITFTARPALLGASYFRVWEWQGWHYAISVGGWLWRSRNGLSPFEKGSVLRGLSARPRHPAVAMIDGKLWVAWTALGDCPERIFMGWVDPMKDWTEWEVHDAVEVLRPEHSWEGADLPLEPSQYGIASEPEHHLRDPAFFSEDGKHYLIYATAGEAALALADLTFDAPE